MCATSTYAVKLKKQGKLEIFLSSIEDFFLFQGVVRNCAFLEQILVFLVLQGIERERANLEHIFGYFFWFYRVFLEDF